MYGLQIIKNDTGAPCCHAGDLSLSVYGDVWFNMYSALPSLKVKCPRVQRLYLLTLLILVYYSTGREVDVLFSKAEDNIMTIIFVKPTL